MGNPVPGKTVTTPYRKTGSHWKACGSRPVASNAFSGLDPMAFGAAALPGALAASPVEMALLAGKRVICQRVRPGSRVARFPRARTVRASGQQLQMIRVHAPTIEADVVDGEPFGDGSSMVLPRDTMGEGDALSASSPIDASVALLADVPCPQPTSLGALDLGFPSFHQCHANIIREVSPW